MRTSPQQHPTLREGSLTSQEIEALARILRILAELPDWDSRIDVLAAAAKIGIIELGQERYAPIREAAGLSDDEWNARRRP